MSICKILSVCLFLTVPFTPIAYPAPQEYPGGGPGDLELIIEYYQPDKAPAYELLDALQRLHQQRGPVSMTDAMSQPTFAMFGETLLLKAPEPKMEELLILVRKLDGAYVGEQRSNRLETFHYQVRHVPLNSVYIGLMGAFQGPQNGPTSPSISKIEDRGVVIFRGTPDDVAEVSELVRSIDVPHPQVLVSIYIIRGTSKENAGLLVPADLSRDLSALVPYEAFEILSTAFLPTDTVSRMEMEADSADGLAQYKLEMRPQAYDPQTGALTFGSIEFQVSEQATEQRPKSRRQFITSTSLRRGQFTVLGAVGADPIFVVAEMTAPALGKTR